MASAEFHEVLSVDKDTLFSTVSKYEDYPEFVDGCRSVEIEKMGTGHVRVKYHVNVMSQDITYTLDHHEDEKTGRIEWHLVESNFFKKNSGRWEMKSVGSGKTDVLYALEA